MQNVDLKKRLRSKFRFGKKNNSFPDILIEGKKIKEDLNDFLTTVNANFGVSLYVNSKKLDGKYFQENPNLSGKLLDYKSIYNKDRNSTKFSTLSKHFKFSERNEDIIKTENNSLKQLENQVNLKSDYQKNIFSPLPVKKKNLALLSENFTKGNISYDKSSNINKIRGSVQPTLSNFLDFNLESQSKQSFNENSFQINFKKRPYLRQLTHKKYGNKFHFFHIRKSKSKIY